MTTGADQVEHAGYCLERASTVEWHTYEEYKHFKSLMKVLKRYFLIPSNKVQPETKIKETQLYLNYRYIL